jgi:hypothetical protein
MRNRLPHPPGPGVGPPAPTPPRARLDPSAEYTRAAFVMACFAALTLVYAVLPGSHSAFHTWTATLLTLSLLWGYVLHQNKGRVPLRSDVLVLGGFTLVYLLPPLYLSLREGARYVDRYEVSGFQPQVSLLTGMAAFVMLAAFRALHLRLGGDDRPIPPPSPSLPMSRALPGLVPVALAIVAARLFLLASGAYYWTYSDEAFVTGRWYSLTISLSRYGLFVPLLLWMLTEHDRRWKVWAWAATAVELAWALPSGSRQALLETMVGFLLVVWWRKGRLPRGRMVALLAAATLAMPILGEYRYTISRYSTTTNVSMDATIRALWDARDRLGLEGSLELSDRFVDRMYDAQFFGYLIKHYRDSYDWEYGRTYTERLPYVAVPYFIGGGDRPVMQVWLDRWYKLLSRGSNPVTLLGEGYVNFGYLGIPVVALALAATLALYEAAVRRLRENVFIDAVYLMHASMLPFMVSTSFVHVLAFLRNALVMMVAMVVLTRMLRAVGVRGSAARGGPLARGQLA